MEDNIMKTDFTMTKQQFYIASIVCLCVLIVAAFYGWFSGRVGTEGDGGLQEMNITGQADVPVDPEIPAQDTAATPEKEVPQAEDTTVGGAGVVVSTPKYQLPAEGAVMRDYSVDNLIYYKTLDQYMVHAGVDIGMPVGTEVSAAADGLVSKVIMDGEMGVTVWLAFPGEVTVVYSNLAPELSVEEGDEVFRGDVIGVTGESSVFEKSEEPHLHLEVLLNGQPVNPNDYFQFR